MGSKCPYNDLTENQKRRRVTYVHEKRVFGMKVGLLIEVSNGDS